MAGRALNLTPVEFDVLLALARSVGRVKTRKQLLLEVAERDFEAFDRSIDVHVRRCGKNSETTPKTHDTSKPFGRRDIA